MVFEGFQCEIVEFQENVVPGRFFLQHSYMVRVYYFFTADPCRGHVDHQAHQSSVISNV